jgi:hypothetical protein
MREKRDLLRVFSVLLRVFSVLLRVFCVIVILQSFTKLKEKNSTSKIVYPDPSGHSYESQK